MFSFTKFKHFAFLQPRLLTTLSDVRFPCYYPVFTALSTNTSSVQTSGSEQSRELPRIPNLKLGFERSFVTTSSRFCTEPESNEQTVEETKLYNPYFDRTRVIPPETSVKYMSSKAYKTTYGDEPVWVKYRRNHKGQFAPRRTRETCIKDGQVISGNPCPICRDEYLVPHYTNVKLLKQFISPYTGETLSELKTCVCEMKQLEIEVNIEKAKHYGLITYQVPFRTYNYEEFYPQLKKQKSAEE